MGHCLVSYTRSDNRVNGRLPGHKNCALDKRWAPGFIWIRGQLTTACGPDSALCALWHLQLYWNPGTIPHALMVTAAFLLQRQGQGRRHTAALKAENIYCWAPSRKRVPTPHLTRKEQTRILTLRFRDPFGKDAGRHSEGQCLSPGPRGRCAATRVQVPSSQ